jgi:signal transduction histidine kinase
MFSIAAAAAYRMWILDIKSLVVALGVTVAVCGLNLVWLRRGGSVAHVGNLSVGIFYSFIVLSVAVTGGFYGSNIAWFCAVPIGAALLVDIRSSLYWTGGAALTTLGFWFSAGLDLDFGNLIPVDQRHGQALFNQISLLAAVMIFTYSFAATQRRTERSLADRNAALHLEAQCVQLLRHAAVSASESDDFDIVIEDCVRRVIETTGWKVGLIWEPLSDGTGEWGCRERAAISEPFAAVALIELSRAHRVQRGRLALGRVIATGRPEWDAGSHLEPESSPRARAATESGLNFAVAIPVSVRGGVVRIVEFFGQQSEPPDERLIDVLCDVGRQLGRVAERDRLHESVRQSQKLESVGQLAAGIAHEINNPMAYVRANLGMLHEEWKEICDFTKSHPDLAPLRDQIAGCEELIAESLEGVDRTVAIVRDMREFARDGSVTTERIRVEELIESSLRIAASAMPAGASVECELEPALEIECIPTRMRQVFLNLVMNAFQALREGGNLRITGETSEERVLVSFRDDGHGIEERDLEHIFEPFYTTKPAGQGTGLGLFISFEIVRWHGGTIEVGSTPGCGACFTINLPG